VTQVGGPYKAKPASPGPTPDTCAHTRRGDRA
jgi:hypothetical protein